MAGRSIRTLVQCRHPRCQQFNLQMGDRPEFLAEVPHLRPGKILGGGDVEKAAGFIRYQRQCAADTRFRADEIIGFVGTEFIPGDIGRPGLMLAGFFGAIMGWGAILRFRQVA